MAIMNELRENELMFVVRHYQENHICTDDAWKRFCMMSGRGSTNNHRRLAVAACLTFIAGMLLAMGVLISNYHRQVWTPTTPLATEVVTETNQAVPTDSIVVLSFEDEPVSSVLQKLSTRYERTFTADDTTKHVTGKIEVRSWQEAVSILEATLNIKINVR